MHNPYRGEVPFPHFGNDPTFAGAVLRFRTGDLVALKVAFGEAYKAKIGEALDRCDPAALLTCLEYGLKKPGGTEPIHLANDTKNDLPFDLETGSRAVWDALIWAWHGKSAEAFEAEVRERAKKAIDEARDLARPQIGSSGSSTGPLGPDSSPTLSGD